LDKAESKEGDPKEGRPTPERTALTAQLMDKTTRNTLVEVIYHIMIDNNDAQRVPLEPKVYESIIEKHSWLQLIIIFIKGPKRVNTRISLSRRILLLVLKREAGINWGLYHVVNTAFCIILGSR
jgi:hypothetical protein